MFCSVVSNMFSRVIKNFSSVSFSVHNEINKTHFDRECCHKLNCVKTLCLKNSKGTKKQTNTFNNEAYTIFPPSWSWISPYLRGVFLPFSKSKMYVYLKMWYYRTYLNIIYYIHIFSQENCGFPVKSSRYGIWDPRIINENPINTNVFLSNLSPFSKFVFFERRMEA